MIEHNCSNNFHNAFNPRIITVYISILHDIASRSPTAAVRVSETTDLNLELSSKFSLLFILFAIHSI